MGKEWKEGGRVAEDEKNEYAGIKKFKKRQNKQRE